MRLYLWNKLLWAEAQGEPYAFCPTHRTRLEVVDHLGRNFSQDSTSMAGGESLLCPIENESFTLPFGSLDVLRRRYIAAKESTALKDADIVDLDGLQVPIVKATPPIKDKNYWAEVRINDTKRGKQLVLYAGKKGSPDKAQIFLDLENDKISFDQNNLHPNEVFSRITADFDSGRTATLEKKTDPKIPLDQQPEAGGKRYGTKRLY